MQNDKPKTLEVPADSTETLFATYADMSIRLDQYKAVAGALVMKVLPCLGEMATRMPDLQAINILLADEEKDRSMREFIYSSAWATKLFKQNFDTKNPYYKSVTGDGTFFGLRAFLTFQWSLFEDFVRNVLELLIGDDVLDAEAAEKVSKCRGNMASLLQMMENAEIFDRSPFRSILPYGSMPKINFDDLTIIRQRRNSFVHWDKTAKEDFTNPDAYYERCMWVLRNFAGNIKNEAESLCRNRKEQT